MRMLGHQLKIQISVFGPETHITAIVPMALRELASGNEYTPVKETTTPEIKTVPICNENDDFVFVTPDHQSENTATINSNIESKCDTLSLFDSNTRCFVYGLQLKTVQSMLDFDYLCKR